MYLSYLLKVSRHTCTFADVLREESRKEDRQGRRKESKLISDPFNSISSQKPTNDSGNQRF